MWRLYKQVSGVPDEFIKESDSLIDLRSEGSGRAKEDGCRENWRGIGRYTEEIDYYELPVDDKYKFIIER